MRGGFKHSTIERLRERDVVRFPLEKLHGPLPELRIGDIILIRHRQGGLMRWLLRQVTKSYWDHVALVIFPKNAVKGYGADIIIEAIQYGFTTSLRRGIEIHRLEKYLDDPEKFDVGIKRIPWLDEKMQNRIRAFVLMNVDTPYYPLSTTKFFFAWLSKHYRSLLMRRQRYTCSGLIQKAFYEAADWEERSKIIFRNIGYTPIQLQDITSPADIAQSTTGDWIWNKHD
ncbi:hypothetical protein HZC53_02645 [Candidatus Uhrbacteria bacterium]|nr:hypothetical protein [Candidatus Uhrbacteria bacterium]